MTALNYSLETLRSQLFQAQGQPLILFHSLARFFLFFFFARLFLHLQFFRLFGFGGFFLFFLFLEFRFLFSRFFFRKFLGFVAARFQRFLCRFRRLRHIGQGNIF